MINGAFAIIIMKPKTYSQLQKAFPEELSIDVKTVLDRMGSPMNDLNPTHDIGPVYIASANLQIPYRIYEYELGDINDFSQTQKLIAACLFTRHHNGFVRQRAAKMISGARESWVPPYVVQLVGEYVVEIIQTISERISSSPLESYQAFAVQNPEFCQLTTQRIISYWHCYHRFKYLKLSAYPGYQVAHILGVWREGVGKRRLTSR